MAPRRSRGCFSCRQRKVKCDETRPECRRCLDRGRTCPGYPQDVEADSLEFRDQTRHTVVRALAEEDTRRRRQQQQHQRPQTEGTPPAWRPSHSSGSQTRPLPLLLPRRSGGRQQQGHLAATSHALNPYDIDTGREARTQVLSGFVDWFLPVDHRDATNMPSFIHYFYSLLNVVSMTRVDDNPAFAAVIEALGALQLGMAGGHAQLVDDSHIQYGTALGRLRQVLQQPESRSENRSLATIQLVATYEMFQGKAIPGQGWFSHVHGAKSFLQNRGPGSLTDDFSLNLLCNCRLTALGSAIIIRKACYFDQPEWLALTAEFSKTDTWSAVIDILMLIPRLLERSDELGRTLDVARGQAFLDRCAGVLQRLNEWLDRLRAETPGTLSWLVDVDCFAPFSDEPLPRTFPTAFAFPTYRVGYLYVLYWAGMLQASEMALRVATLLREEGQLGLWQVAELASPDEAEAYSYAVNICRCAAFCCQPRMGSVGRISFVLPLWFTLRFFAAPSRATRCAQELSWCRGVFAQLERQGFHFGGSVATEGGGSAESSPPAGEASAQAQGTQGRIESMD